MHFYFNEKTRGGMCVESGSLPAHGLNHTFGDNERRLGKSDRGLSNEWSMVIGADLESKVN